MSEEIVSGKNIVPCSSDSDRKSYKTVSMADLYKEERNIPSRGTENNGKQFYKCEECNVGGDLLLSCESCPCKYHLFCLNPPLEVVPEGQWFCPKCTREKCFSYPRKNRSKRVVKKINPEKLTIHGNYVPNAPSTHDNINLPNDDTHRPLLVRLKLGSKTLNTGSSNNSKERKYIKSKSSDIMRKKDNNKSYDMELMGDDNIKGLDENGSNSKKCDVVYKRKRQKYLPELMQTSENEVRGNRILAESGLRVSKASCSKAIESREEDYHPTPAVRAGKEKYAIVCACQKGSVAKRHVMVPSPSESTTNFSHKDKNTMAVMKPPQSNLPPSTEQISYPNQGLSEKESVAKRNAMLPQASESTTNFSHKNKNTMAVIKPPQPNAPPSTLQISYPNQGLSAIVRARQKESVASHKDKNTMAVTKPSKPNPLLSYPNQGLMYSPSHIQSLIPNESIQHTRFARSVLPSKRSFVPQFLRQPRNNGKEALIAAPSAHANPLTPFPSLHQNSVSSSKTPHQFHSSNTISRTDQFRRSAHTRPQNPNIPPPLPVLESSMPENHNINNISFQAEYGINETIKERQKLDNWSEEELDSLWIGVRRHGCGNWDAMIHDPKLTFEKYKTSVDLVAKWQQEQRKFSCEPSFNSSRASNIDLGNGEKYFGLYPSSKIFESESSSACDAQNSNIGMDFLPKTNNNSSNDNDTASGSGKLNNLPHWLRDALNVAPPTLNSITPNMKCTSENLDRKLEEVLRLQKGKGMEPHRKN